LPSTRYSTTSASARQKKRAHPPKCATCRARWLLPPGAGDIDDQRGWIWYGLASAHHAKDELDQAAEWYQRLIDGRLTRLVLPLQYVRSLYYAAQIHDSRGETEKAAEHYRRFLEHWEDGEIDRDRVADAQKRLAALTAGSPDHP
jgi:tetratricopeptide (TPR) repeat protein